ncbi:MAG: hypothetical protein VX699_04885 [Myxococcota bacterium]|nr:hypothetical protein [Myxococcota bacterium]
MVSISASAPGKLVLLGEYAVLEGGVALVAAVGVRSRVTVKTWRGESCILDAPGIGIDHVVFECHGDGVRWPPGLADEVRARLGLVDTVLTHFLKGHGAELLLRGGLHFQITTSEFFSPKARCKMGMGSSAATCVALTTALMALLEDVVELDTQCLQTIFERSFALHREAQGGVGSGVDIAASVFGGWLEFEPASDSGGVPVLTRREKPGALITLPVFTGEAASTVKLVNEVFALREADPGTYRTIMDELMDLAREGARQVQEGDASGFMTAAAGYLESLSALGGAAGVSIVSEPHRRAVGIVGGHGGTYKSSGAGGGDIGLGFFPGSASVEAAQAELEESGLTVLDLEVGVSGVELGVS